MDAVYRKAPRLAEFFLLRVASPPPLGKDVNVEVAPWIAHCPSQGWLFHLIKSPVALWLSIPFLSQLVPRWINCLW